MFGTVDVVALEELARKAAGVDVSLLGDSGKLTAAAGLARTVSLLSVALAHLMADVDARGICEAETGLSAGSWLARETGLPKRVAAAPVTVGRSLRGLALIDDAVTDGRLRVEHALHLARRVNPRVADAVAVVQDQIIEWATEMRFEAWAQQVSALIALLDHDGADPGDDRPSELTLAPTTDGLVFLQGRLAGADAVLVRQTLEAKADELFHRYQRDRDETGGAVEIPPRSVLLALALVEVCQLANARDIGTSKPARPDVTLIVRAGQPLTDDPTDNLTNHDGDDGDHGGTHPTPARTTAEPARHEPRDRTDPVRIPVPLFGPTWPPVTDLTGVRLQDATTRALLCDPDLHALIVDRLGVPLDLGRRARLANDDQRRALLARDGGCAFPGCDRPPGWCDAHHVTPYQPAGRTDLANLALLCRRHHGITHRTGWTMHATDDHWFWWTAPNGHTFWSQRHGHRRTGPVPP